MRIFFKRAFFTAVAAALLSAMLCGCAVRNSVKPNKSEADELIVLCSAYPQYDWAKNITDGARNIRVEQLMKDGVDMHSFQASAEDIIRIYDSDLFILNGGESDRELLDIAEKDRGGQINVLNMMSELGSNVLCEEPVDGSDIGHDAEEDEHIWLSLKNAEVLCRRICSALSKLDSENAELYSRNTEEYIKKLAELDERYRAAAENSQKPALVFADRFPFRYLAEDYSIGCFAAFSGCSSETEASFNTVLRLAGRIDEFGLDTVLTVDGGNGSVADAVIANTAAKDLKVRSLNSMQSVTREQLDAGMTYLSVMEENLDVISEALGSTIQD